MELTAEDVLYLRKNKIALRHIDSPKLFNEHFGQDERTGDAYPIYATDVFEPDRKRGYTDSDFRKDNPWVQENADFCAEKLDGIIDTIVKRSVFSMNSRDSRLPESRFLLIKDMAGVPVGEDAGYTFEKTMGKSTPKMISEQQIAGHLGLNADDYKKIADGKDAVERHTLTEEIYKDKIISAIQTMRNEGSCHTPVNKAFNELNDTPKNSVRYEEKKVALRHAIDNEIRRDPCDAALTVIRLAAVDNNGSAVSELKEGFKNALVKFSEQPLSENYIKALVDIAHNKPSINEDFKNEVNNTYNAVLSNPNIYVKPQPSPENNDTLKYLVDMQPNRTNASSLFFETYLVMKNQEIVAYHDFAREKMDSAFKCMLEDDPNSACKDMFRKASNYPDDSKIFMVKLVEGLDYIASYDKEAAIELGKEMVKDDGDYIARLNTDPMYTRDPKGTEIQRRDTSRRQLAIFEAVKNIEERSVVAPMQTNDKVGLIDAGVETILSQPWIKMSKGGNSVMRLDAACVEDEKALKEALDKNGIKYEIAKSAQFEGNVFKIDGDTKKFEEMQSKFLADLKAKDVIAFGSKGTDNNQVANAIRIDFDPLTKNANENNGNALEAMRESIARVTGYQTAITTGRSGVFINSDCVGKIDNAIACDAVMNCINSVPRDNAPKVDAPQIKSQDFNSRRM